MTKQVTNEEIMQALNQFANQVEARFVGNNKQFDSIDKRFDSIDKQFDSIDKRFDQLEADVGEIKTDVHRIYDILDKHMSRIEQIVEENAVQTHQQERLQRWIFQLADKTGVQLKYE